MAFADAISAFFSAILNGSAGAAVNDVRMGAANEATAAPYIVINVLDSDPLKYLGNDTTYRGYSVSVNVYHLTMDDAMTVFRLVLADVSSLATDAGQFATMQDNATGHKRVHNMFYVGGS